MATYNFNCKKCIVASPKVKSLDNNCGTIEVSSPSCTIDSVASNCGKISVAEFSSTSTVDHNYGKIEFEQGSNIGVIGHNYGKINVQRKSCIFKIMGNQGKINVGDNCTIDLVEDNKGKIFLGDSCIVKAVSGTGGKIECGSMCQVAKPTSKGICGGLFASSPSSSSGSPSIPFGDAMKILQSGLQRGVEVFQTEVKERMRSNGQSPASTPTVESVSSPPQFQKRQAPLPPSAAPYQVPPPPLPSAPQLYPDLTAQEEAQEELLCGICMEEKKNMVFSCGHTCCGKCAATLQLCHICRTPISQKIQLFL